MFYNPENKAANEVVPLYGNQYLSITGIVNALLQVLEPRIT